MMSSIDLMQKHMPCVVCTIIQFEASQTQQKGDTETVHKAPIWWSWGE